MIYSVKFKGYWPVGAVAIVKAPNRGVARRRFLTYLGENYHTLLSKNADITLEDFEEIHILRNQDVQVLLDGNY